MKGHEANYKRYLNGTGCYVTSYEILKFDDAEIILLENYQCKNKAELLLKEQEWLDKLDKNCVNKFRASGFDKNKDIAGKKIYRETNKVKIAAANKIYNDAHKIEHAVSTKRWKIANKEIYGIKRVRYTLHKRINTKFLRGKALCDLISASTI